MSITVEEMNLISIYHEDTRRRLIQRYSLFLKMRM